MAGGFHNECCNKNNACRAVCLCGKKNRNFAQHAELFFGLHVVFSILGNYYLEVLYFLFFFFATMDKHIALFFTVT